VSATNSLLMQFYRKVFKQLSLTRFFP